MKIYKVKYGCKDVPVRSGASKHANIIRRLEENDKVFSEIETSDYAKIKWVEFAEGHGNDPMGHGWVCKEWLVYRGEG